MTLGERIQKRREQLRMTQEELATRSGISQGLISRIERGQTPSPGVLVLRRLARTLMCSIDWLVDLYADDPPDGSWLMPAYASG